jgi:hypothetical protein
MAVTTLPPLISSDGHLEVRPERWTPRMPAKYRERAPRTVKLPDGGDAILVEGQAPSPAPFLDLRAGRNNETWQPFGVTVDDTAGVGPPEQRAERRRRLVAEVLFPNMQVGRASGARWLTTTSTAPRSGRTTTGWARSTARSPPTGSSASASSRGPTWTTPSRSCTTARGSGSGASTWCFPTGKGIRCPRTIASGPPPST